MSPSPGPQGWPSMPEVEDRCPVALVLEGPLGEGAFGWIATWKRWRKWGLLPYDGDLGDQPAWLAEGLMLVDREAEDLSARAGPAPASGGTGGP